MKINRKILTRTIFWIVYSYILYIAIVGGWWIGVVIVSPFLFFIFYREDILNLSKYRKKEEK
tara:strand:+ start:175 stop:360 length:186 start_codon:yes stop_codon:yes gene_type:complete